jgi:purine-binding chemotaxis protein CheW
MGMEQALTYSQKTDTHTSLVTFRLGWQTYALPIEPIVQIIEMVAVTPIPQVNHSVEGAINYHGVATPVINLRRHLDLPEIPLGLDTHILVVQVKGRMIGLIVDQVQQVIELANAHITAADDFMPEELGEVPMVKSIAHTPEGTVMVFDLDHLLLPQQVRALAEAMDTLSEDADEKDDPASDDAAPASEGS